METLAIETWVDVCALEDVPIQGSRIVKTDKGCLALFRTTADEVYALDDKCPHKGGPLSQGMVAGNTITCPLHNWVFSMENGHALGVDEGQVATTPARLLNGRVQLNFGRRS